MPDWSIKIVPSPDEGATFVPDLQGAVAGAPLVVLEQDIVTWNNATEETHHPWPTDENYEMLPAEPAAQAWLTRPIPAQQSSSPAWIAAPSPVTRNTIFYCCKMHPQERGQIIVAD